MAVLFFGFKNMETKLPKKLCNFFFSINTYQCSLSTPNPHTFSSPSIIFHFLHKNFFTFNFHFYSPSYGIFHRNWRVVDKRLKRSKSWLRGKKLIVVLFNLMSFFFIFSCISNLIFLIDYSRQKNKKRKTITHGFSSEQCPQSVPLVRCVRNNGTIMSSEGKYSPTSWSGGTASANYRVFLVLDCVKLWEPWVFQLYDEWVGI